MNFRAQYAATQPNGWRAVEAESMAEAAAIHGAGRGLGVHIVWIAPRDAPLHPNGAPMCVHRHEVTVKARARTLRLDEQGTASETPEMRALRDARSRGTCARPLPDDAACAHDLGHEGPCEPSRPCEADWTAGRKACPNPATMRLGSVPCCDECWHDADDETRWAHVGDPEPKLDPAFYAEGAKLLAKGSKPFGGPPCTPAETAAARAAEVQAGKDLKAREGGPA